MPWSMHFPVIKMLEHHDAVEGSSTTSSQSGACYLLIYNLLVHTGDRLITTKQNRDKHGYGVQQIRNTAEKYGGFYLLDFNENICEAQPFLSRKRF